MYTYEPYYSPNNTVWSPPTQNTPLWVPSVQDLSLNMTQTSYIPKNQNVWEYVEKEFGSYGPFTANGYDYEPQHIFLNSNRLFVFY